MKTAARQLVSALILRRSICSTLPVSAPARADNSAAWTVAGAHRGGRT